MISTRQIKIFNTYKKDISKYDEIINISEVFFDNDFKLNLNVKFEKEFNNYYNDFIDLINSINIWENDEISLKIKGFLKANNIKFPTLGKPIRYILTNNYNGASINEIFMILGKKQSMKRLQNYKI